MNDIAICPCETFVHPRVISNPPGRSVIAYRVGDYTTFRHAMLLSRPLETELANWRPSAKGDLALQMVEWWAYLADILTFYNERVANQAYLRTADLPESVQRLIHILGYRPRPGIGATGVLAALMSRPTSFTLPQGFPIQSKPGPGKQPQIFELAAKTQVSFPDVVPVDVSTPLASLQGASSVLLKGAVTTVKVGDELLVLKRGWVGVDSSGKDDRNYALAQVTDVQQEKGPRGNINTRVTFSGQLNLPDSSAHAINYRLLKSVQSAHVWQYPTAANVVITNNTVDLESITRQTKVSDPILFEIPNNSTPKPQLVSVTSYTEVIWYANTGDPSDPRQPPKDAKPPPIPIPIPHTSLGFKPPLIDASKWDSLKSKVLVRYAWQDVGQLIETPSTIVHGTSVTLSAVPPATFPTGNSQPLPVLLEDTNGKGVTALASAGGTSTSLELTGLPDPRVPLTPPLRVLFDLLSVSRGKTVPTEILGSGDATVAGQEFVLQKSPLTYLLSGDSTSGASYKSTLHVWVDGIEWKEMPSFYGQTADAYIFVTREDENNRTLVQFGDGINGARLPSGSNNIFVKYRYGSGAEAPDAGQLTVITQPQPNLKAIRNPVAVGGGADPDSPKKIKRYAPQSVLTFGRAVSGDDYETIAAQAPGVARARSYWAFDPNEQRALVRVYVGDNDSAVNAAKVALAHADDPNRPVRVRRALTIPITLFFTLRIDPAHVAIDVITATRAAMLDDDTGLFGVNVVRIGQPVYQSQIYAACLAVPGILAVHSLFFLQDRGSGFEGVDNFRYDPGEGGFFQLQADTLIISQEVSENAG
jgi:hypothetical protein